MTGKTDDIFNFGAGDEITDPEALAFYHTRAKFGKKEGQDLMFPRASSLYDACMRMHVLACRSPKKIKKLDDQSPNQVLTFSIGSAVHFLMQNTPAIFGDRRIGLWECLACGNVLYFGKPPVDNCPKCGASKNAIFYREHAFNPKKPLYCGGHPDLFLASSAGKPRPLEAKTMEETAFGKLTAPLAAHDFQLQTYFILMESNPFLSKKVDTRNGYLFYVGKKVARGSMPFKMFHVKRNKAVEESILGRLREFREGYEKFPKKLPMLHNDCQKSNLSSWRSRNCPCLKLCKGYL